MPALGARWAVRGFETCPDRSAKRCLRRTAEADSDLRLLITLLRRGRARESQDAASPTLRRPARLQTVRQAHRRGQREETEQA